MTKKTTLGIILLIILTPLVLFLFFGGMQYITAPFRGMLEKREKIQASGDFRIYSYEHFYDLCRTIQQTEAEYDSQYDLLKNMEKGEDGYSRQQRTVAVLKAQVERLKRQYNANARKEETVAAFKSSDLPEKVNTSPHKYGERTNCSY